MSALDPVKKAARTLKHTVFGPGPTIPVVRLEGVIAPGGRGSNLNLAKVEKLLAKAFAIDAPVVVIAVNSPGGSPVQSKLIHDRIRALSEEKTRPVIVACEDVAASGGYMIAVAGDEIWCDGSSILGSIGVVSASFGFTDLMQKLGVERRMRTAGENKSLGDPFSPETDAQKARLERVMKLVHAQFIELVKSRRSDKLVDDPDLFSGEVYVGPEAVEKGLADRVCDPRAELRERYGEDVKLKAMSPPKGGPLSRLMGNSAAAIADELETREVWSRFGLK